MFIANKSMYIEYIAGSYIEADNHACIVTYIATTYFSNKV